MLDLIQDPTMGFTTTAVAQFMGIFLFSLLSTFVLIGIVQLLVEGYKYVTDTTGHVGNPLLSFTGKHRLFVFDAIGSVWGYLALIMFSIVYYKLFILGTIIFAIMYLARFTTRIKTALTKHIEDKKAHK